MATVTETDGHTPLGNGVPLADSDSIDDTSSAGDCGSPSSSYPGSPLPEAAFLPSPVGKDAPDVPLTTRSLASADAPDVSIEHHQIRAVVRVRPFSSKDPLPLKPSLEQPPIGSGAHDNSVVLPQRFVTEYDVKNLRFVFDAVIWPKRGLLDETPLRFGESDGTQQATYEQCGAPEVAHALRGCNVCILAYGQTGSGKSHSLFGPPVDPGITPRAATELFAELEKRRANGISSSVDLQILEIYNETVADLLAKRSEGSFTRPHRRTHSANTFDSMEGVSTAITRDSSSTAGSPVFNAPPLAAASLGELPVAASTDDLMMASYAIGRRGSMNVHELRQLHAPVKALDDTALLNVASRGPSRTVSDLSAAGGDGGAGGGSSVTHRRTRSGSFHELPVRHLESDLMTAMQPKAFPTAPTPSAHNRPTLLVNGHSSNSLGGAIDDDRSAGARLRVRFHPDFGAFVDGARRDIVNSAEELETVIEEAMIHRVTAATLMNDTSSRSHAIIQVTVRQEDRIYGRRTTSIINFVDLAGSERVGRSGVAGAQFNEARNINLSLTTLRRVIDILIENAERRKNASPKVPPYRESTLTFLLADSFGGNSRTTLLATVSPHAKNINDTISTLRYAQKAQKIVCRIHVNQVRSKVVVAAIQAELDKLGRLLLEEAAAHTVAVRETQSNIDRRVHVAALMQRLTEKKREAITTTLEVQLSDVRQQHAATTTVLTAKLRAQDAAATADDEARRLREIAAEEQRQIEQLRAEIAEIDGRLAAEAAAMDATVEVNGERMTTLEHLLRCQRRHWRRAFVAAACERREMRMMNELRAVNTDLRTRLAALQSRSDALRHGEDTAGYDLSVIRKRIDRAEALQASLGNDFRRHHMDVIRARADVAFALSEVDRVQAEIAAVDAEMANLERSRDCRRVSTLHETLQRLMLADLDEAEAERMLRDRDCAALLQQLAAIEATEQQLVDEAPQLQRAFLDMKATGAALLADIRVANVEADSAREALMTELIALSAAEQALETQRGEVAAAEEDLQLQQRTMQNAEVAARERLYPDAPPPAATAPLVNYTLRMVREPNNRVRSASREAERGRSRSAAVANGGPLSPSSRAPSAGGRGASITAGSSSPASPFRLTVPRRLDAAPSPA